MARSEESGSFVAAALPVELARSLAVRVLFELSSKPSLGGVEANDDIEGLLRVFLPVLVDLEVTGELSFLLLLLLLRID